MHRDSARSQRKHLSGRFAEFKFIHACQPRQDYRVPGRGKKGEAFQVGRHAMAAVISGPLLAAVFPSFSCVDDDARRYPRDVLIKGFS